MLAPMRPEPTMRTSATTAADHRAAGHGGVSARRHTVRGVRPVHAQNWCHQPFFLTGPTGTRPQAPGPAAPRLDLLLMAVHCRHNDVAELPAHSLSGWFGGSGDTCWVCIAPLRRQRPGPGHVATPRSSPLSMTRSDPAADHHSIGQVLERRSLMSVCLTAACPLYRRNVYRIHLFTNLLTYRASK